MRVLCEADYPTTPWKNGGGTTREVAVFPEDADMNTFDWRISMATVEQDGPFSVFDGIDRTLFVLEGEGVELNFSNGDQHILRNQESLSFPADAKLYSRLLGDTVIDLNIMSRRGRVQHSAMKIRIDGTVAFDLPWETTALFCLGGKLVVTIGQQQKDICTKDCLMIECSQKQSVTVGGNGNVILIGMQFENGNAI